MLFFTVEITVIILVNQIKKNTNYALETEYLAYISKASWNNWIHVIYAMKWEYGDFHSELI